ncbi:MAG: formyltransferase family protein [Thermodesulfovibrionales bacterium]|nr:formyltransferase family protein [Thermodesulfovibrionales bacterium]
MQIGWFSTGRDEEARRLLQVVLRERERGLRIDIAFLFCNRERGESPITDRFLDYAESQGLKTITFSSKKFLPDMRLRDRELWREEYHNEVWKLIRDYRVEFSFLAGYMLIAGKSLTEKHRMLNLHPAIPGGPKGSWQEVVWELIRTRAYYAGAQIHLVTPELDEGPAVTYCRFSLRRPDFELLWNKLEADLMNMSLMDIKKIYGEEYPLFKRIREEEFLREIPLIIITLKRFSERGFNLEEIKAGGIDLSEEIERFIRANSL